MTTFYIYEVIGHKNGATKDWDTRSQYNFETYGIMPILIETMEGPDTPEFWQVVGDREWELADQNGYPRGTHYRVACERGRVGGARNAQLGNILTIEARAAGGRATGRKNGKKRRVLNSKQCAEIRDKFNTGFYSKSKLAKEYKVGRTTILRVITNINYEA